MPRLPHGPSGAPSGPDGPPTNLSISMSVMAQGCSDLEQAWEQVLELESALAWVLA